MSSKQRLRFDGVIQVIHDLFKRCKRPTKACGRRQWCNQLAFGVIKQRHIKSDAVPRELS